MILLLPPEANLTTGIEGDPGCSSMLGSQLTRPLSPLQPLQIAHISDPLGHMRQMNKTRLTTPTVFLHTVCCIPIYNVYISDEPSTRNKLMEYLILLIYFI